MKQIFSVLLKKRALLSFFVTLSSILSFASNYYVSSSGNDLNSGLSADNPWRTIAKVNSAALKSGDLVFFRRGDTFYGPLVPPASFITYGAYGTGAKPIITGFQTVAGWVSQGNGIYAATTTASSNCNMVTVNGVNTPMGRYPKTGWLTFESFAGRTSITDAQLPATPNWTGAEVVIKKNNWTIDRSVITNHSGGTITYSSGSTYNPTSVYGNYHYFIQKSMYALTQMGDWYCNGGKLYMYFGTNNPANYTVMASALDNVININSKNTIVLQDLAIEGGNVNGAYFNLSVNVQFKNCDFNNHGTLGISGGGSQTITVDGCIISNCNGKGIDINAAGSAIRNSRLSNIAIIPGMGEKNGASYLGIKFGSTGGVVEYNEITNCGYIPINFAGNNSKIRYNKIDGFSSLFNDGAGIYTYSYSSSVASTGIEVYNNIVMNGAHGLYSEGVANHVSFHDNVVFNMGKNGIQMMNPLSNIVNNNLFYNCGYSGISLENNYTPETGTIASNNSVTNNLIVFGAGSDAVMNLKDSKTFAIGNFGISNYNIFLVGADGLNLFTTQVGQTTVVNKSYTFTGWKTFSSKELNSTQKVVNLAEIQFEYNATKSPKTITLTQPMIDAKGTKYSGSITLSPYTSVVLMKDAVTQPVIGPAYYVSSSGSDLNSGISPDKPWRTISKVNSAALKSGDKVLFRSGDTFYGQLIPPASYVTFGAYGTGAKPVITGFQTITGWVSQGNGIYAAPTTASADCNMVTVNGVNTPMGRYPKTGWLSFESFVGKTSITDAQLPAAPNWTGAEVVIKKNNWTIDRSLITNHSGGTITYSSGSAYTPVSVYGNYHYFIQKSTYALTQVGDWYCSGGKMYMYFGTNNPANYTVKASTLDKLINIYSRNTLVFQDLVIEGSNVNGAYVNLSVNIQFRNCDFNYHGALGISGGGSQKITVDGCNIDNCNGKGIDINATYSVIRNSVISNIAVNPGMGEKNGYSYLGIKLGSLGGIIEYNEVTNCGYIAISFTGDNAKVRYNKVDKFCNFITDGGGIYTYDNTSSPASTGMEVHNNIVMNGGANGIYSDGVSNHISYHDNVVFNMVKNGIHMNNPTYNTVNNNTIYNCTLFGLSVQNLYDPELSTIAAFNKVFNNVVAQGTNSQLVMNMADAKTFQLLSFGTSDNNRFVVESDMKLFKTLQVLPSYLVNSYTLGLWRIFSLKELNSVLTTAVLSNLRLEYNASKTSKTVALATPMIDAFGNKYSTSITLLPYTGVVLMPDLSLKSGTINSGMDLSAPTMDNIGSEEITIDVFPNPTKGKVTVQFSRMPEPGSSIHITDMSGTLILSRIISSTAEMIDLSNQSSGLYLLRFSIGAKEIVKKLVLNKI